MRPALTVGCAMVLKSASQTPLSVLHEAKVLLPWLINVVPGAVEIGQALSAHPGVVKIIFTESKMIEREIY